MSDSPAGRPPRRQWGRFAIGLSVSLLGGWLFAALYLSAGGRKPVVVVARDVGRYEVIQEGDLATERVAAGDRASTIPGGQADDLVGRLAATQLTEGMVLSPQHVVANEDEILQNSETLVGALLSPDDMPDSLTGGDRVTAVIISDDGVDEDIDSVRNVTVLSVRRPEDRTGDPGDRFVRLIVPEMEADQVTAAAKENRLAVRIVPGG